MPNGSLCRRARFGRDPGNGVTTRDLFLLDRSLTRSAPAAAFTELAERPESGTKFARPSGLVTLSGILLALISGIQQIQQEFFSLIQLDTAGIFQPLLGTLTQM